MRRIKLEMVSEDEEYILQDNEKIIDTHHHRTDHEEPMEDGLKDVYTVEYVVLVIQVIEDE